MMLSEIRSVLICAVISAGIFVIPATPEPRTDTPLDNAFVTVGRVPPATKPSTIIADCTNTTGFPFVRLFVPSLPVEPSATASGGSDLQKIFATYFAPHEIFGCTPSEKGSLVYINLKSKPPKSPFNDDAVRMDPAHNEVLLDNDRVRVVRIHFAPGESGPIVDKRPRVIVAVTGSHATVTFPDGHSETRDVKAGEVSFGNAGRQATKNTGTTAIENIVVELKSKKSEKK